MAFKPGVAVPPFVKSAAAPAAPKAPAAKKKPAGKKKSPAAGPQASAIMGQMLNGPGGSAC
jgi:hypothetical protein